MNLDLLPSFIRGSLAGILSFLPCVYLISLFDKHTKVEYANRYCLVLFALASTALMIWQVIAMMKNNP